MAPGPDWLGAARAATEDLRGVLAAAPTTAQRALETGTRGEGGDRTLEIDAAAEAAVLRRLEALHADGARFAAVSEERGRVDFGFDPEAPVLVVIDPLDGSKNAKRGLPHHALSLAVADGSTMADVVFGFVHDLGPGEEWVARRGEGALLNGAPLDPDAGERRVGGKLELLGIESADPRWVRESADALADGRAPAARGRRDRGLALPGRRGAARRHGHAAPLPRGRRRRGPADRARGRRVGRVHGVRLAAGGAAGRARCPVSPIVAARSEAALAELARVPTLPP